MKAELKRIRFQRNTGYRAGRLNDARSKIISDKNPAHRLAVRVFDGSHISQQLSNGIRLRRASFQFDYNYVSLAILSGDVNTPCFYGFFATAVSDSQTGI